MERRADIRSLKNGTLRFMACLGQRRSTKDSSSFHFNWPSTSCFVISSDFDDSARPSRGGVPHVHLFEKHSSSPFSLSGRVWGGHLPKILAGRLWLKLPGLSAAPVTDGLNTPCPLTPRFPRSRTKSRFFSTYLWLVGLDVVIELLFCRDSCFPHLAGVNDGVGCLCVNVPTPRLEKANNEPSPQP